MSDFIEWVPKHHGHKPLHWTPDMLTSVDGKNFVRQTNWAWIAGSTYYVPPEAVGLVREDVEPESEPEQIDELVKRLRYDCELAMQLGAEARVVLRVADVRRITDLVEDLRAENERLASVATDFASSLIVAENNLSHVSEENERLREALRVYAGPMEWTQEGGWGVFPVWADGYPGGVYIDDNTLDFGEAARAALEKQPCPMKN